MSAMDSWILLTITAYLLFSDTINTRRVARICKHTLVKACGKSLQCSLPASVSTIGLRTVLQVHSENNQIESMYTENSWEME